jgi:TRAP-type mannitol/chloroaromatic compound transport system permease large subunit
VKVRKELWFGFTLMAGVVLAIVLLTPWTQLTNGHLGLIMLALIVVAIMLGFPTAFTLMGMGVAFAWLAYRSVNPDLATRQVLDLMVQRAYGVMSNDVLIAVPLFVFMGYLVERAALIERLFKALHLSLARVPGSLAVATIATCAIFATATGIVGAVVTLMGLLALPAMLRAGYNIQISAGSITAGGCLGILIPPSVLLIVYGATAGVSVVQLYAGAFFPGFMLAALYVGYVIVLAKWKPSLMPPLPASDREVSLSKAAQALVPAGRNAFLGLTRSLGGATGTSRRAIWGQWVVTLLPALVIGGALVLTQYVATSPASTVEAAGAVQAGGATAADVDTTQEAEPAGESAPSASEPPGAETPPQEAGAPIADESQKAQPAAAGAPAAKAQAAGRLPTPAWFWIAVAVCAILLAVLYWRWTWQRLEVFKMLLSSFFPLAILILAVLGSIVFGLATPTEAAAVGAFGGVIMAAVYRYIEKWRAAQPGPGRGGEAVGRTVRELGGILKESAFLTAKTSAMVCWLFVGSAIFSAAFALLGGQEIVERWVLSLDLSPIQFMVLSQVIIFLLGWPLEWTEIIVIFMPIFIPLLGHFNIDPLFFGLVVALNLQTAFLSPPVAMAAFYLKGVSPPHVTLNQIFAGMMPFMAIQVLAIFLLYAFPEIGLWLPSVVYGK